MKIKKIFRKAKSKLFSNNIFPASIDQGLLIRQAAEFFNLPLESVHERFEDYRLFSMENRYSETFGERKTLSFEEAFLLYLAVLLLQPRSVVEIGTQYGKSTRRILDLLKFAGLEACQVTCFDIKNQVKYFSHDEAHLVIQDVSNDFRFRVLEQLEPGLIFLDAHPYRLLFNAVTEFLNWSSTHSSILAIHDCSPLLYNPRMKINKGELDKITSQTGVWERHVLSEVFTIPNVSLDDISTSTYRSKIFKTQHGLALIMPKR